jgi:polar amino acid transport system permease protein
VVTSPPGSADARSARRSGYRGTRPLVRDNNSFDLDHARANEVPPLLNDFISLQKDTAQVGLLGAIEANKAAEIYSSTVFNYSSFVVAAILFLLLTIPLARFTDHLIRRDQARRLAGAGQ